MRAALCARFSTEKQSEASMEDQHRVCERIAERHGFTVTAGFSDAAISAGTAERPGYRALLGAARCHEFNVIVAEDHLTVVAQPRGACGPRDYLSRAEGR